MRLDEFTLPAFASTGEAEAFWKKSDERKFFIRSFFMFFGVFAFLVHGAMDVFAGEEHAAVLLKWRVTAGFLMTVVTILFHTKRHTVDPDTLICIFLLIAGVSIIAMTIIVEGDAAATYPFGLLILLAYGGAVLNPRSSKLTVTCLAIFVGYWVTVPFANISGGAIIVHAFFFSIGTFSIIVGAFTRERYERLQAKTELRLVDVNRNLEASRDEAIEAKRTQAQFFASMSHELRTPLNAINGFSELMMRELLGPIPTVYKEYSGDINASGLNLLANIEDLLDIQRLSNGKISWEDARFSLDDQVRLGVAMCQSDAAKAEVELTSVADDFSFDIYGDRVRITQAITNLITNSVKFTEPGGRIVVSASIRATGDLGISVSDTGIGIAANDLDRIQDPFEQAEDGTNAKKYGGLGLGLSIVSGILERMEGDLELKSKLGAGTVATIVIPKHRIFIEGGRSQAKIA